MPDWLDDVDRAPEARLRHPAETVTGLAESELLLARAGELERRRLQTLLAGVTAGRLTALRGALADAAAALAAASGAEARDELERARTGLDDLIDRFRGIARGVYPAVLRDQGPFGALDELAAGLPRPVLLSGGLTERLEWEVESGLYHPAAAAVCDLAGVPGVEPLRVQLTQAGGRLSVRIRDAAPLRRAPPVRVGLADEAQRLAALGGDLTVTDSDGAVVVHAWLPDRLGGEGDPVREAIAAARRAAVAEMDRERRAIERDLHDGAQHHLVSLRLALGMVEHEVAVGRLAAARGRLDALTGQVDVAEAVLARTAGGKVPPVLAEAGLAAALAAELGDADARLVAEVGGRPFPVAVEAAVYFCCLEAVGNARKHAPGAAVTVHLRCIEDVLIFEVRDDGPGFDVAAASQGRGLRNIADRMAAVNGSSTVEFPPGGGCVVRGTVGVPSTRHIIPDAPRTG